MYSTYAAHICLLQEQSVLCFSPQLQRYSTINFSLGTDTMEEALKKEANYLLEDQENSHTLIKDQR